MYNSVPGWPCSVSVLPAATLRMSGFLPLFMMRVDNSRSSAVSTAVTSAGDSSSPHGLCWSNASRYHVLKSMVPLLCDSLPSAP